MKHVFIINPAAGARDHTLQYIETISSICRKKKIHYEIHVSQEPGDCTRIAREEASSGRRIRLYACGGDGTLNEVVAGTAGFPEAEITVYPGGSGNDFIKMFRNPKAFYDLESLLDAKTVEFDLIRCNDDLALNICSVGLDARIGTDVSSYKRIPLLHGFRAYAASTIVNVIKGISEHYVVEVDGQTIDGAQTMICACSGRYYGGGFNPVPEADPRDGMLDVLLVGKVTRLQVPGVIGKYKSGQYRKLPKLVKHFRTKSVTIKCDKLTAINLDGELRRGEEIKISIADEKIRFFYPAKSELIPPAAITE